MAVHEDSAPGRLRSVNKGLRSVKPAPDILSLHVTDGDAETPAWEQQIRQPARCYNG